MSLKFKVGDKVRISNYPDAIYNGQEGVVIVSNAHSRYPYTVTGEFKEADGNTFNTFRFLKEDELVLVPGKPTLATAVGLQPQTRKILNHLEKRGSISPMEALTAYGCFRLAAQVHNLRKAGFDVQTDLKEDEAGHRYARYRLAA